MIIILFILLVGNILATEDDFTKGLRDALLGIGAEKDENASKILRSANNAFEEKCKGTFTFGNYEDETAIACCKHFLIDYAEQKLANPSQPFECDEEKY